MTAIRTTSDRKHRILNLLFVAIVTGSLLCSLAFFDISHGQTVTPPDTPPAMPPPETYHGDPPHPHLQAAATCRPDEQSAYYTISNQGNADITNARVWLLPNNTMEDITILWPNSFVIIKGPRPSSIYVWRPGDASIPFVYAECPAAHTLNLPFLSNADTTPIQGAGDD